MGTADGVSAVLDTVITKCVMVFPVLSLDEKREWRMAVTQLKD
jgi:hypothetical protein